jgi:membrane fusion protein, heavy metal efflux system
MHADDHLFRTWHRLLQPFEALTPRRHSREGGNPSPITLNADGLYGVSLGPPERSRRRDRPGTFGAGIMKRGRMLLANQSFARKWGLAVIAGFLTVGSSLCSAVVEQASAQQENADTTQSIELTEKQLTSVKTEAIAMHEFPIEKQAVGSIDFNEELLTQVFTPYQGRIIKAFVSVGDEVKKDQTLFTIDSPDLVQAVSTLIAAAGVLELTTRNLDRQRKLYNQSAAAQKDYEQAISDQQTAEGGLRAARDAVRIFGKTDAEIDKMIAERKIDPVLVVPSPIAGLVTARVAAPGLLVQPGNPPAPYTIADISIMWMLANIPERDIAALRVGQEVAVSVPAYPGKVFKGKISTIGATVDPNTRRVLVRSEIADPDHELRSGMLANFSIAVAAPKTAIAVPETALVREGDGSMTLWFTRDQHVFRHRTVKTGLSSGGFVEIAEGAYVGELVATEGAIFVANQYANAKH